MRAAALQGGQLDALLLGEAPRQRAREDTSLLAGRRRGRLRLGRLGLGRWRLGTVAPGGRSRRLRVLLGRLRRLVGRLGRRGRFGGELGSASSRGWVCQYELIPVVAVSLKKKKKK